MRLYIENETGMLAKVLNAIAEKEGDPGAVDVVKVEGNYKVRDITVSARNEDHSSSIVDAIRDIEGVKVHNVSDEVFLLHLGGKIHMENKVPVDTRNTLSMAYTPGVGRISEAIAENKEKAQNLTIKKNTVAVVSDGSAVLGLGNIGPEAAMPVMEGKAMLLKEFAEIDGFPLCLDSQDVDEIVRSVELMSPGFGGINLEDISAPRCFEIEERLKKSLDIPVFHDDQHGTAIVTMAATLNALKIVDKQLTDIKVVIVGAGAAGVAITKILEDDDAYNILCCDSKGIINRDRMSELNNTKQWLAENTNPDNVGGTIMDATEGADLLIGVSAPGVVPKEAVENMAEDPIVFAMSNPVPEIMPEEINDIAKIIATGRSDYPNQINNVLAFPGLFRGAIDARATDITEEMKLAAAHAIADSIDDQSLDTDYIVPSVFNKEVANQVAEAVKEAAYESGVARRPES